MYRVTIQNGNVKTIIHDDYFTKYRLTETSIAQSINSADSFQFNILPDNPGYSLLEEWTTYIKVENTTNSNIVFKGRISSIQVQLNSDGSIYKQVICESQMAFLNDSIQMYKKVQMKPYDFFKYLIDTHNSQVDTQRQFQLGNVTVTNSTDYIYCYVEDGLNTFDEIDADLLTNTDLGGELKIRNQNGIAYIDWTLDQKNQGKQEIKINKNLISLISKPDLSGTLTVLYPFGATIESDSTDSDSTDTASDVASPRLNISSVNDGKMYIESSELISQYGRISGTKSWDDVTVASNLLTKAKAYLETFKPVTIGYELEAVDLFQLGLAVDDFEVGNYYHTINQLEGIDDYFRIISISLDINNPLQSSLTIGEKSVSWAEFQLQRVTNDQTIESLQAKATQLEVSSLATQSSLNKFQETLNSIPDDLKSVKDDLQKQIDELKNGSTGTWVSGSIFIDTSSNNSLTQSQFNNMYSDGAKGLIVKLTEGTTYTNSTAPTHIGYAKSAGMSIVGAYHFLRGTSTGTAQGQAFLAQLKAQSISTDAIVACDIESSDLSTNLATLNSMISDFYAVLTAAGYTNTADYASSGWFGSRFTSTAKFKWIASWSASTAPTGASAWQFTDSWKSYGVDASYSYAKAFI